MGGMLDTSMMSVTGNADFASDFNMIFDPEGAHITLTAPWKAITVVGSVSNDLMLSREYLARLTSKKTALTSYIGAYYEPLPMWDEMTAAIAADPTLITSAVDAHLDIDTSRGPHYGHAFVVPMRWFPMAARCSACISCAVLTPSASGTLLHRKLKATFPPTGSKRTRAPMLHMVKLAVGIGPSRIWSAASPTRPRRSMTWMARTPLACRGSARACTPAGQRRYARGGRSTA